MRPAEREPIPIDPQFKSPPLPSRAALKNRPRRYVIREDGVVFEYSKHLIKRSDFRLYTGPVPCNIEEGMKWLYGEGGNVPTEQPDDEPLDVETATKGQLIVHARQKFNKKISPQMTVDAVRNEVRALIEAHAE